MCKSFVFRTQCHMFFLSAFYLQVKPLFYLRAISYNVILINVTWSTICSCLTVPSGPLQAPARWERCSGRWRFFALQRWWQLCHCSERAWWPYKGQSFGDTSDSDSASCVLSLCCFLTTAEDLLVEVFRDGILLKDWTLEEVRKKADIPNGPFSGRSSELHHWNLDNALINTVLKDLNERTPPLEAINALCGMVSPFHCLTLSNTAQDSPKRRIPQQQVYNLTQTRALETSLVVWRERCRHAAQCNNPKKTFMKTHVS